MRNSSRLFEKLCNFWGIIDNWCWDGDLISPMGTHRISWMPQLRNDCRRLTYEEFLALYSAPRSSPREGMFERREWRYRTSEESEELNERKERAIAYLAMGVT